MRPESACYLTELGLGPLEKRREPTGRTVVANREGSSRHNTTLNRTQAFQTGRRFFMSFQAMPIFMHIFN